MSLRKKTDISCSPPSVTDHDNSKLVQFLRSQPVSTSTNVCDSVDVDQQIAYMLSKARKNKEIRTMLIKELRKVMDQNSVKAKKPYEKFLGMNLIAVKDSTNGDRLIKELYSQVKSHEGRMDDDEESTYETASEDNDDDYFSATDTLDASLAKKGLPNPFFSIDTRRMGLGK